MRLIAIISISHAKFHCSRLTTVYNCIMCKEFGHIRFYTCCRLFMSRTCAGCLEPIQPEEMVMLISDRGETETGNHDIYHARCFACLRCDGGRPLAAGEYYGIQDGRVYCRAHYCELQLELRQVRGDVWGPVASATPKVRRTGMRGRPRKLRTAARPPDNPSPRLCEPAVTTTDTESRKSAMVNCKKKL